MIFRQFFEPITCTYTYLLACEDTRKALMIDTVSSEVATYRKILAELDVTLIYTLETHVHADHITAASTLREQIGSKSIVHRDAGAQCADLLVTDGVQLQIGHMEISVLHTPGHTNGCVSYVVNDRVFTGDCLLINGCGRTDFQQGDAGTLYDSITQKLFTLADDTLVYPGHDYQGITVSTIKQEKQLNKRLGQNKSREEFIALMQKLDLAYPKFIDQALPANQACGQSNEHPSTLIQG